MTSYVTQAPKMMQDMAPDLAAQQIALQRQQQMADLIRQQGMAAPDRTEMVSGVAVKQSPLISLSKMLQVYMGGKMQENADEKSAALGKALTARQSEEIDKLLGGAPQSSATAGPVQPAIGADGQPGAPAPQQSQQSPPDPRMAELRASAKAAILMGNKDLANKLIENMLTMTEGERQNRYLGIDRNDARTAEMAKRIKDGTMSLQPGQTNILPGGGRVVAPDFNTGIAGGFDDQGKPMMSPIAGSEALASMAGAKKRAEAAGSAGFNMITVNTPDGPRMMTEEQAAKLSQPSAGAPQASTPPQGGANLGFPSGTQIPQPTPGMQPRSEILQQEYARIAAMPDSDPRKAGDLAAIQRELGGAGKVSSMPGIPLQSDAQKAEQVGKVNMGLAIEQNRLTNAQAPEQQQKIIDAGSVLGLLEMANPLLNTATGSMVGAFRDKLGNIVGQSSTASESAAQLAAIGGALVSKMPKMSGPQSDKDVQLYKEMAGQIGDPNIPSGAKRAASKIIQAINEKYINENKGSVTGEAVKANQGNAKIRRYNPATQRIE